jgi:hypothetical protein
VGEILTQSEQFGAYSAQDSYSCVQEHEQSDEFGVEKGSRTRLIGRDKMAFLWNKRPPKKLIFTPASHPCYPCLCLIKTVNTCRGLAQDISSTLSQMLKLVILAILIVPSIMASIHERVAKALIADKDTGNLEQTFWDLYKRYRDDHSSWALVKVAEQGHLGVVAACLRAVQDLFPNDKMRVSGLVHDTLLRTSLSTRGKSESFAKVITSFKPTDVKPLASIRDATSRRSDAVNVLERVMDQFPELITGTLPSWLASHRFDQNSQWYTTAREEPFQYLASLATESVLEKTLSIVKANEHYKVDWGYGPNVECCKSQDYISQDLIDKLTGLLELLKDRNEIIRGVLQSFLPRVLVDLILDYAPN